MEKVKSNGPITLKQLRERANLSKADVYRDVGVSSTTYYAWEEGTSIPALTNVISLAKVLKTPIHIVCAALGLDLEGVPTEMLSQDSIISSQDSTMPSQDDIILSQDYEALVRVLKQSPNSDAAAIVRLLFHKKGSDGTPPTSTA